MGTLIEGAEREAEPVTVETAGNTIALSMDDGRILVLDWAELCEAVEGKRVAA